MLVSFWFTTVRKKFAPQVQYFKTNEGVMNITLRTIISMKSYFWCIETKMKCPKKKLIAIVVCKIHWSFSTTLADNDYDVVGAESSASHLWLRHSMAVARLSGSNCSIGVRNSVNPNASSCAHSYFSVSTSYRPHGRSLVMCRNSPVKQAPTN